MDYKLSEGDLLSPRSARVKKVLEGYHLSPGKGQEQSAMGDKVPEGHYFKPGQGQEQSATGQTSILGPSLESQSYQVNCEF